MASATLSPYKNSTQTQAFVLTSQSSTGALYKASGRELACPYSVEVKRSLTPSGATSNDEVAIIVRRVERNVTTGKLATFVAKLTLSIPKDSSILTSSVNKEVIACLQSLLNEGTATEATLNNIGALLDGRDL